MLKGKNRFGEEKEMQGDHLVKGRRLCLGEDVGGEGCVLMAFKREKEDGRACGWCWLGESAAVLGEKSHNRVGGGSLGR